jgi:hypothetical protein
MRRAPRGMRTRVPSKEWTSSDTMARIAPGSVLSRAVSVTAWIIVPCTTVFPGFTITSARVTVAGSAPLRTKASSSLSRAASCASSRSASDPMPENAIMGDAIRSARASASAIRRRSSSASAASSAPIPEVPASGDVRDATSRSMRNWSSSRSRSVNCRSSARCASAEAAWSAAICAVSSAMASAPASPAVSVGRARSSASSACRVARLSIRACSVSEGPVSAGGAGRFLDWHGGQIAKTGAGRLELLWCGGRHGSRWRGLKGHPGQPANRRDPTDA